MRHAVQLFVAMGLSAALQAGPALIKASLKGNVEGIKSCLAAGENINEPDKYGWTPLMWAVYYRQLPATELLLERGADPNLQATYKYSSMAAGTTALHLAAYYGQEDLAKALVKKGARTDLADGEGKRALDFAIQYNFTGIKTMLARKGGAPVLVPDRPAVGTSGLSEAMLAGDRKKAIKELADRLSVHRGADALAMAECGRAYLSVMDTAKAKEILAAAEELGLKDGQALRTIGFAWLKSGHKPEAMAAYDKALQRDPDNVKALTRCAVDLIEVGLLSEAEKFMKAVHTKEARAWESFLEFGRALLIVGQRKPAAAWFARALEANPGDETVTLEILRAFADSQALM